MSGDARRAHLADQARKVRRIDQAKNLLSEAGVWTNTIPKLLAIAAKPTGDPLPRIEAVTTAAKREWDKKRKRGEDFHEAKWVRAAIEENWNLEQPPTSRRTA